jgi:starch-binding outer membrane protein, SusD/RagB family
MTLSMTKALAALVALSCSLAACGELDIPDLNNPSASTIEENPTRSVVLSASTGLLLGARTNYAAANGYVAMTGILGRELYNFDTADPRFVTEMLASPQLDPGSPAFGGNLWSEHYANIRNAGLLRAALDKVAGVTPQEAEAIRGFSKTIEAWNFLMIATTRSQAPIDVHRPLGSELAPIESHEALLTHVSTLLDEARVHLLAGGSQFPFPLSSGFEKLDTPATFVKFNRALAARTEVYREHWQAALDAVGESFLDPDEPLTFGAYHVYGTTAGDLANGLISPNLFVHPSISASMEHRVDGAPDLRVARAIQAVEERTVSNLSSSQGVAIYRSGSTPMPYIRNEELLLLRAEALLHLGQVALAADDLNAVRTASGGLAARTDLTADNILDELLKQRRYSLLFEGGHSWIDARRYGRLDQLPLDLPTHTHHAWYPIPEAEMNARK